MNTIEQRLQSVLDGIEQIATQSGRNSQDIVLVCVSKKRSIEEMNVVADYLRTHSRDIVFGESYVQEFEKKRESLPKDCSVHLIGPLQSNKAARAVQLFDLIESVHSEKILRAIDREAKKYHKTMPIFIQVNISHDPNKSGFEAVELEKLFATVIPQCSAVQVQGLMTITEFHEGVGDVRHDFKALFQLCTRLSEQFGLELKCSMGMSADFSIAIEEGATHVRIGSAIFG